MSVARGDLRLRDRRASSASGAAKAKSTRQEIDCPVSRSDQSAVDGLQSRRTSTRVPMRAFSRYKSLPGWTPNPVSAALIVICVRVVGALVSPIADCDETFNYWEPLHWLLHGSGLRTWEYSPDFALRSYAFLLPYACLAHVGSLLKSMGLFTEVPEKVVQFLSVRVGQAVICALGEIALYDSCVFRFGKDAARLLLMLFVTSPGMFRACGEFLPSSFAMIAFMFASSHWLVGEFNGAVGYVALAALLGWPFAALLGLPIALHVSYRRGVAYLVRSALLWGGILLCFMIPVDSYFYGKLVITPGNIVRYNVFPVEDAGPEIYGVEPVSFYMGNLALNCLFPLLLTASSPILFVFWQFGVPAFGPQIGSGQKAFSRALFLSPPFLWLGVFLGQSHKEERFMAPVYPLLCLVGAVALSDWCTLLAAGSFASGASRSKLRTVLKNVLVVSVCILSLLVGISRCMMQVGGFRAPSRLFKEFSVIESQNGRGPRSAPAAFYKETTDINVCVGSEWYRFPSHFFLPGRRYRLKFIRSGFSGLLPKPFPEVQHGSRVTPPGMNMFNRAEPDQFLELPLENCHYFFEREGEHITQSSPEESLRTVIVLSEDILDLQSSSSGYRAFWVPGGHRPQKVRFSRVAIKRNTLLVPVS